MLDIVVGIKYVPNTTNVNIDPKTGTLVREGVPSVVNPHDLVAVELALRLRDRYGGSVTAISMAPPQARAGLEHVLGMGVDRAILISDRVFAGADTLATSYVLAKAIEKIGGYDLIIMGQETIDSSTGHIGAQVASWLNLPYIYYVVDIEYVGDGFIVTRELEDRVERYRLGRPALISAKMYSLEPRHVTLENKLRAVLENRISTWSNKDLGLDPNCVGLRGSPTIVSKVEFTPKVPRKNIVFDGDVREAVKKLVKALIEEGVL